MWTCLFGNCKLIDDVSNWINQMFNPYGCFRD